MAFYLLPNCICFWYGQHECGKFLLPTSVLHCNLLWLCSYFIVQLFAFCCRTLSDVEAALVVFIIATIIVYIIMQCIFSLLFAILHFFPAHILPHINALWGKCGDLIKMLNELQLIPKYLHSFNVIIFCNGFFFLLFFCIIKTLPFILRTSCHLA